MSMTNIRFGYLFADMNDDVCFVIGLESESRVWAVMYTAPPSEKKAWKGDGYFPISWAREHAVSGRISEPAKLRAHLLDMVGRRFDHTVRSSGTQ